MNPVKTEPKKKVLLILHLPPPIHGAAMMGQYIRDSALLNEEFEADFINLSTSTQMKEIGKGGWKKISNTLKIQAKVLKALTRKRYDLCYFTLNSTGPGFHKDLLVVAILKLFGKKTVYHFHNKGIRNSTIGWFKNLLYKFAFRNSKSILLSPSLYRDFDRYVARQDVFFCPNGIPVQFMEEAGRQIAMRRKYNLLFLSNMVVDKGVYVLLDACRMLKQQGYVFECNFVGAWADISEAAFQERVSALGLEDEVVAHGPVYNGYKQRFLENADIFILPTLKECFPLVLLEAMSYGLPVVSTEEGGIPDIVEEQRTGLLVPTHDAAALAGKIAMLLDDPGLRKKYGNEGKQRFLNYFTIEKFEQNFVAALHSSISSN